MVLVDLLLELKFLCTLLLSLATCCDWIYLFLVDFMHKWALAFNYKAPTRRDVAKLSLKVSVRFKISKFVNSPLCSFHALKCLSSSTLRFLYSCQTLFAGVHSSHFTVGRFVCFRNLVRQISFTFEVSIWNLVCMFIYKCRFFMQAFWFYGLSKQNLRHELTTSHF